MITSNCGDCGKEFKQSGTDFEEKKAAGLPMLCEVCRVKPPEPESKAVGDNFEVESKLKSKPKLKKWSTGGNSKK